MPQISKSDCIELKSNPGFYLEPNAGRAWDRASAAFGKVVLISGAWRSYETQVELFDSELSARGRYVRGNHAGKKGFTTDVRGRTADGGLYRGSWWTRKAGTAAAAVPGTSNHGAGLSVDALTARDDDDPPYEVAVIFAGWEDEDRKRFLRIAKEHGWDDDEGQSVNEFWHLTYYRDRDQHRGEAVPTPPSMEEEDFMAQMSEAALKAFLADIKYIKDKVDDQVLEGPYTAPPKERKWVTVTRALRLIRLVTTETRDNTKVLQAELRGLRTVVETMAKNQNLDPERIYALVDKNLQAATADLKITFSTSAEDEEQEDA